MQAFAILCLAAVALARPQGQEYSSGTGAVTTVTERTYTIRGQGALSGQSNTESDKYYGNSGVSSYSSGNSGVSSYSSGASGYSSQASAQPGYSFETVATAVPQQQQSYQQTYQQTYQQAAAPAVAYQYQQAAAPAVAYQAAAPAYTYQAAAPAYAYQAASYQAAAPAVAYQAAPAVAYQAAPVVAYQAVSAAPAYQAASYQASAYQTAAPVQSYQSNYQQASNVGVRSEDNYETSLQNSQVSGTDTKIYKHVYAFSAPEEPAVRASVRVQAPVNKKKHYKLIFIKAPQQQTVVDSDITLPAQEEEKTLIYVLSKNQKQVQPEIRIKQAQSSKHAKPEVFFLKYKNEQEAQAIASGAISGQNADVPANGEIISDGSVSLLGKSSQSSYGSSSFGSSSGASNYGASSFGSNLGSSGAATGFSFGANLGNSYDLRSGNAAASGLRAVSAGSVGIAAPVPVALVGDAASSYSSNGASAYSGAGLSGGFSAYKSASYSQQEPASVSIKVSSEPEAATASSLSY